MNTYFICITDKGGRSPTCPDMAYHLPQSHLIKSTHRLTNIEVLELVKLIGKTRLAPKVVGTWVEGSDDEHTQFEKVINYDNILFEE